MGTYGQLLLPFVAPLAVAYVALLGIGYLVVDQKAWLHRRRAPNVHEITHSPTALAAETQRSLSRLPPRMNDEKSRWFRRTIAAYRPRSHLPLSYK
jgi:hypothetical protein